MITDKTSGTMGTVPFIGRKDQAPRVFLTRRHPAADPPRMCELSGDVPSPLQCGPSSLHHAILPMPFGPWMRKPRAAPLVTVFYPVWAEAVPTIFAGE
jgi:hypothetical protein